MVEIIYHRYGSKNEDCNYLETTPEQRNELYEMINDCTEIFSDIEVNIVKLGLITEEMSDNKRIKEDIIEKIYKLKKGKALLRIELKPEFRDEKICYCTFDKDFNETITFVFHEMFHFEDPFDFNRCIELKEEIGHGINLEGYLRYNVKANLSEFHANYRAASKLLNQSKFKDIFINRVKNHFGVLKKDSDFYEQINGMIRDEKLSMKLIDFIFQYKFSEFFFRIMGIWRTFKKINEFQAIQDEWDNYISRVEHDDYIAPGLYKQLAEIMLNEPIESLESKIWLEFKEYFSNYHDFNLEIVLN